MRDLNNLNSEHDDKLKEDLKMENKLGDRCFCDSFTVENGILIAEVDGMYYSSAYYNSYQQFMQAIIDRVYDCAMGNLN